MEYKISKSEAKVLVIAAQSPVKDNFADMIAVKLNMNSSYISGIFRRLELAKCLTLILSGKRRLIEKVDIVALEMAKSLLVDDKK